MSSAQIGAYGRGRASGHRQPSMGRDNLINAFAPPPFPFISGFLLLWLYTCLSDEASVLEFVAFCIRAGSSVRPQGPVASGKPEAPPATSLLFEAAILIMRRCSGWKREGGGVCIM